MKLLSALLLVLMANSAWADILVPVRTIRAKELITAEDLMLKNVAVMGALSILRRKARKKAEEADEEDET